MCGVNIALLLTGNFDECVRNEISLVVAAPGIVASPYTADPPCGCGGILYGGLDGFGGGTGR